MNNNFYHPELLQTPEGVRDIYGEECAVKNIIKNNIQRVVNSYGFESIETPSFEYFDIFSKERGSVLSNEMFKFFDRDNNTLVLRPDITPSIARCVAKYYENEILPVRICYTGNTYINNHSHQGKMKESTQLGAELINDGTSDADAEMIVMTIECLLASGLKEFQIDVGSVGFFEGLIEMADLNPIQIKELKDLLLNKNVFAASQFLSELEMDEDIKNLLIKLPESFGNSQYFSYAKEKAVNEKSQKALERLEKLYGIIDAYGYSQYVNIDLGMLSSYTYYTGIIFRAYTYGTGEPVATGGRYDSLLSQFGHNGKAIGFVICIDQLMLAIKRQKITICENEKQAMIVYDAGYRIQAINLATKLRTANMKISMIRKNNVTDIEEYIDYAVKNRIDIIIDITGDSTATIINTKDRAERLVSTYEISGEGVL